MNTADQELVERLQKGPRWVFEVGGVQRETIEYEAAARLTSLSRDNERMAKTIAKIAKEPDWGDAGRELTERLELARDYLELANSRTAIAELPPPQGEPRETPNRIYTIEQNAEGEVMNWICNSCWKQFTDRDSFAEHECHPNEHKLVAPGVAIPDQVAHFENNTICTCHPDPRCPLHNPFTQAFGNVQTTEHSGLQFVGASQGNGKPVAWMYELIREKEWELIFAKTKPAPSYLLRNITPLYAHPPSDSIEAWRLIDTAPLDGTKVDLWCRAPGFTAGSSGRVPECWYSNGKWWRHDVEFGDDQCRSRVHNVTHWMPLPPDPLSAMRTAVSRINPERKEG